MNPKGANMSIGTDALISRNTWRIVIIALILLVLILAALWIVRYARNSFASNGGGKGSNAKPDGTPASIPTSVDQSYIERIVQLVYQVNKEEEYAGYSEKRCEITNNILGMRDEELAVLSILLQQKYQLRLGATIGRWKGDGCFTSWLGGDIEKLQNKVKNY
jgi:hypothetical protein